MTAYRIGEVARLANVNLQTLHYYERVGLLTRVQRTSSNYRLYSDRDVKTVQFIKRAQELGFSLKDIRELLSLRASPDSKCADVRHRAETKLEEIDRKIDSLLKIRRALGQLVEECAGEKPATECPILEALEFREAEACDEAG